MIIVQNSLERSFAPQKYCSFLQFVRNDASTRKFTVERDCVRWDLFRGLSSCCEKLGRELVKTTFTINKYFEASRFETWSF